MRVFIAKVIYQIVVGAYHFFIGFFSLFNEKAYKFSKGRINQEVPYYKEKTLWFHCASLGEFEQAKPLMEWCYKHLDYPIILTFFSPSGYTYKNNYSLARAVYYLPKDNPRNSKEFIKKINPQAAFFIKYEFWFFYLQELKEHHIPHFLVAGIFRPDQIFFKPYGILHRIMLQSFTHLFVQDEDSLNLLAKQGLENVSIAFDTRFDTVMQISKLNFRNEVLEKFKNGQQTLIVGSSWPRDEALIKQLLDKHKDLKVILAPHDVNPHRISQIKHSFPTAALLSEPNISESTSVLVIDNVGKLSLLYRYADICYLGGGFGVSVHNVLEAAVYGKALIYGPNHGKSKEALDLVTLKAAQVVYNEKDLNNAISNLQEAGVYQNACEQAKRYVELRTGGTLEVMTMLKESKYI